MNGEATSLDAQEVNLRGSETVAPEAKTPRVFISYSHDSSAHKKWVGDMASNLVRKGVDVIFDQWDVGPGDDVVKFMERAVAESDRVLMVCTETYVRKVDDGKGGVGYEAMVVTGELIQDLGTAKFIPIVLQESGGHALPRCVSTRFWVNLSEGQNVAEQLEILLHELHNAPKLPKPQLGKNPFAAEVCREITTEKLIGADGVPAAEKDPGNLFGTGLALAKHDDLIGWRRLVQSTRQEMAKGLAVWREKYERIGSVKVAKLPEIVYEAAAICSPLISLAVAGAVSGNNKFGN
jgi:TIR domain